tara:strand:+ start:31 stop:1005 length:975 start_codon:yes stop_codon:yes gene_type:complete
MIKKIKLDLFKLKSKKNLESVYQFFKKKSEKWFDTTKGSKSDFFTIKKCNFCNSSSSKLVFEIDSFYYHKCLSCKSLYTKPFLSDESIDSIYSDGMYKVYQDKLVKKGEKIRKNVLDKRKFEQINMFLSKCNPTLLDVGCGQGTFLNFCRKKGWRVEGVDPSHSVLQKEIKKNQIKIHIRNFEEIKFNKTFDIITFWGVLEHLSDPIYNIKKAFELLNKGGMLVFEVPSADCFISKYLTKYHFSPTRYIESGRHNIFFSKNVIEQIATQFDSTIELIESNGLDIQTILFEEFDHENTQKIINIQDILNDLLLGDHYRVFMKKVN